MSNSPAVKKVTRGNPCRAAGRAQAWAVRFSLISLPAPLPVALPPPLAGLQAISFCFNDSFGHTFEDTPARQRFSLFNLLCSISSFCLGHRVATVRGT